MAKYLLSICIPTYNRPELVKIIERYMSLDDMRFCVCVSDNCSIDGTYEKLQLLAKENERLILSRNSNNMGFRDNYVRCMSYPPAEYVIFNIDKDEIDVGQLPSFIDILEKEKPYYGYVPYRYSGDTYIHTYIHGVDAMCNCAFLNRHPSGYFFRKDLFKSEMSLDLYRNLHPSFGFQFDMAMGGIGAKYDALVVNMPLVTYALKSSPAKTLSYNEDNIYFGLKMRLITFSYYMDRLALTDLSSQDKALVAKKHLNTLVADVTNRMRTYYADYSLTQYYNLSRKEIGYFEMLHNMYRSMRLYVKVLNKHEIPYNIIHLFIRYNYKAVSLLKRVLLDYISK